MEQYVELQIWGGIFYFLSKVFFSLAERAQNPEGERRWRVLVWSVYLIGLPAWALLFVVKHNWIAAGVEVGGGAAMLLGLVAAVRGIERTPRWFDWFARIAAGLGLGFSLHDFGGITTFTQVLELSMTAGFLVGVYFLARQRPVGYLWFLLMLASNATLMWVQGFYWLVGQQIISIVFIADAYYAWRRKHLV